ncbi:cysteine desulfurase [Halobacteriovorax sp. JY17]|uniref:aminotransferase class V-fold PLP-dependent enzyme n=1 Tax=Halobacteriovorax sp. JY17 TaxID=2014617 RepID=UPI000C5CDF3A|nr:cysteine desulfurase [Halobacteriovorax sp. JY17]PIK14141.1 MAG: selenocysteine lyase [Halobacteriovorax sp. JY17]
MALDPNELKKDFPVFENNKKFIYFDNACTSLRPKSVVSAMNEYYELHPSCHNRTLHSFGVQTTKKFENARNSIANFIGAESSSEIVFTRNTTEAINIVAKGINWQEGDHILTSDMEHNSNLLPWQFLSKEKGVLCSHFEIDENFEVDLEEYQRIFSKEKIKLVAFHYTSNVTGGSLPVKELSKIAKENGALVLIDCAQAMLTTSIDVQDLNADFIAFSFHKCLGPSGLGALYGKRNVLEALTPMLYGGETVIDSTYESCTFSDVPYRFEAGLQNYSGAFGAKAAIDYIQSVGVRNIRDHLLSLNTLLTDALIKEDRVTIIGPKNPKDRPSILNFTIEGLDLGQISLVLDKSHRIMVRSGVHCCHSWFHKKGLKPSLRVSLGPYNTKEEVEKFIEVITPIIRFF